MGRFAGGGSAGLSEGAGDLASKTTPVVVWPLALLALAVFVVERRASRGELEEFRVRVFRPSQGLFVGGCHAAIERFGLSSRKGEVLLHYAKGRSVAHIAGELVVSEEAIKTHIKHVYAKMDVHSRRELLDKVEAPHGWR